MCENKGTQYKKMILLGSTGSVGRQATCVADARGIEITELAAGKDWRQVEVQARKYNVKACAMADEQAAKNLRTALADTEIKVYNGSNGICEMISQSESPIALNAITGKEGLMPTLATIDSGKELALANKESLVIAGEEVSRRAKRSGIEIRPVDSEHCAIAQCLLTGRKNEVKNLILTASGGPFYKYSRDMLKNVSYDMVMNHPTWNMGAVITVNSATLMNKGFEVIEAAHLFGVSPDRIKVLVHRESIIHSMVEYIDNSITAQLAVPDMRLCVQYALSYPERDDAVIEALDFEKITKLTFGKPDTEVFPLLACALDAVKAGGALPAVLNAANEVAVNAFLNGKLEFFRIPQTVMETIDIMSGASRENTLDGILEYDREARALTATLI